MSSEDEIRTFLALDLPDSVLLFLEDVINRLKKSRADVRWVNPKSIHLTLKFLGNVNRSRISDIEKNLRPIFAAQQQMDFETTTVGAFPNLRQPRVVWTGVTETSGQLVKIVSNVEEVLYNLGFQKEIKAFTPHLTLGRARSPRGKEELVEVIHSIGSNRRLGFVVERAILFQSILEPSGPRYNALAVFDLPKAVSGSQ
ncbi:MAG: RNA 2',3'-cyclic phosphodiesterase [Desulfomonilaceae bacterium]